MKTTPIEPLPPTENKPESLEESVLGALNMFDPATALHELERLDDDVPPPPADEQFSAPPRANPNR